MGGGGGRAGGGGGWRLGCRILRRWRWWIGRVERLQGEGVSSRVVVVRGLKKGSGPRFWDMVTLSLTGNSVISMPKVLRSSCCASLKMCLN